jgi:hypothetical protein
MTHSKIHQAFSNYLKQPDVLTHPANYLGPNWEDVLNFWIYVDTLSEQEREEMWRRYCALDDNVRWFASNAARAASDEVVCWKFKSAAWDAAAVVTGWWVFGCATWELIAHHKLLEQDKTPLALQCCIKP